MYFLWGNSTNVLERIQSRFATSTPKRREMFEEEKSVFSWITSTPERTITKIN